MIVMMGEPRREKDHRPVWLDDLERDVQYAVRTFARFPGFTAVVLLTLAIGIGANTAIFTAVHAVLLTPLPYPHSEQLVRVWENVPGIEIGDGKGPGRRYPAMDVGDLLEISDRAKTITAIANYGFIQATATYGTDTTRLEGFSVSGDFFRLLGATALIGRTVTRDDATPARDEVVVLSYDTWQRFGGREIVGRSLTFGGDPNGTFGGGLVVGTPYTIVGVMPRDFRFPSDNAQFWVPRVQRISAGGRPVRRTTVARLASGVAPDTAAAEFTTIRSAARGEASDVSRIPRYELVRLHDEMSQPVKSALLVLTVAVGMVLLIACVNIANLLLARGLSRRRELAVRAALGAGRGRLTRQLLTESVLLSLVGGAGGAILAFGGVRLFRSLGTTLSRSDLGTAVAFPRLAEIHVDASVLAYAAALSIMAGIVFGLVPAWRHSHAIVSDALHETTTSSRATLKNVLVVAEIALATLLLVSGGLLINSFIRLVTTDPGFDPSHLLTFQVGVSRPSEQLAFAETLVERLQAVPGVIAAAYARQLPMVSLQDSLKLTIRRNGVEESFDDSPDIRFVSHDYLRTIGVPVVSGRSLAEGDGAGRPPVILVNEALAHRDLRGTNPVGQTILLGSAGHRIALEVIGVVGNVRQLALDRAPQSQYFIDIRQVPTDPVFRMPPLFPVGAYYVVRTAGNPTSVLPAVRDVVNAIDAGAALDRVATMEQILSNSVTRPRMYAVLVGIFSGIAVVLAAIGLYGVMAYSVSQRTREIGIRMALGAERRSVVLLVVRESAMLIVVGLGVGLLVAGLTTRYLQDLLFGLTALDPVTFVCVAFILVATTLAAAYVPARRAASVDPLIALRCE